MRANLIAVYVMLICGIHGVSAQNANPFELLWRKDTTGLAARVIPPAKSEPVIPITPVTPAISAEINPSAPDTTNSTSSTPLTHVESDTASLLVSDTLKTTPDTLKATADTGVVAVKAESTSALPGVVKPHIPAKSTPLTLVLLFGVIFTLLAWGMSLNRELLKKIYRAALNENLSSLLYREQRFATTQYLYYTIYVIFFLNGGMFLYFLAREFGWTAWALQSVWSCIAMVLIIYILRHLSLNILGNTYPLAKETTHFSFNIVLHNILLGIGLIPVNLFLAFGPDGLHRTIAVVGIILCSLIYLMRQFRGLIISGSVISANPFRFFVYLCAVEILPLFTLVKFFHN